MAPVSKAAMNRIVIILGLSLCIGCTQYGHDSLEEVQFVITDESVIAEAEMMALFVSGELLPPEDLFDQIFTDLIEIRNVLGNDEFARIRFEPRWEVGHVILIVDPTTGDYMQRNIYREWDELHDIIEPVGIEVSCWERGWVRKPPFKKVFREAGCSVTIRISESINPLVLIEQYKALDGIESARAQKRRVQDPNIYIKQTTNGIEYLFAKTTENTTRYTRHLHAYYSNGILELKPVYLSSYDERVWKEVMY